MFDSPCSPRLRLLVARLLLAFAGACALIQSAAAAPDSSPRGDPLLEWLSDRGLVTSPAEGGMVQALRDRASDLVLASMNFLGVPYRFGGESAENGFDCSGFTRYVYEHSLGLVLPRRAAEQASSGSLQSVDATQLQPGDLVFFNTMKHAFSHVGIYVGDHKFIHAPRTGAVVRMDDMRASYWTKRFNGARRVPATERPAELPRAEVQANDR